MKFALIALEAGLCTAIVMRSVFGRLKGHPNYPFHILLLLNLALVKLFYQVLNTPLISLLLIGQLSGSIFALISESEGIEKQKVKVAVFFLGVQLYTLVYVTWIGFEMLGNLKLP